MNRTRWAGVVLLLIAVPAWWTAPLAFHAAWLAAWWFSLGIVLGAVSTAWIHRLTGGHWGEAAAPAVHALSRLLPWTLLAALPWLLALPSLYRWWDAGSTTSGAELPALGFQQAWLQPHFFLVRLALYGLMWLWLARLATPSPAAKHPANVSKRRAAAALLIHGFLTSLAAVDIVMSLMPHWYSTGFGLVMLVAQGLAGTAMAVWWTAPHNLARVPQDERSHAAPIGRDLGNLLLMYTMSWGYLAFMEFLIIWAENLPHEIAWYLPRMQTFWLAATLIIVLGQLALPMIALLFRSVKDNPARVRAVALLLLCANGLYCVWLILPSLPPAGLHGWWIAPLITVGLALLLFGRRPQELRHA